MGDAQTNAFYIGNDWLNALPGVSSFEICAGSSSNCATDCHELTKSELGAATESADVASLQTTVKRGIACFTGQCTSAGVQAMYDNYDDLPSDWTFPAPNDELSWAWGGSPAIAPYYVSGYYDNWGPGWHFAGWGLTMGFTRPTVELAMMDDVSSGGPIDVFMVRTRRSSHACDSNGNAAWTLVRHTDGSCHTATDLLKGTDEYGTYGQSSPWSVKFEETVPGWDQLMFASGDCTRWIVMTKEEAIGHNGRREYNGQLSMLRGSASESAFTTNGIRRSAFLEDPWILLSHEQCDAVYCANAYPACSGNGVGAQHQGLDVYIRRSEAPGICCNDFASEESVDACLHCSGTNATQCTNATCAPGFSTFMPSAGICCNDFASEESVDACLECSGPRTTECTDATCAPGFSTFMPSAGICCNDFAAEESVDACLECSGPRTTECTNATCAPGFSTFMPSAGICCNNLLLQPTAVLGSCTECTGTDAFECTNATCVPGYHDFSRGRCCLEVIEVNTGSGCACAPGFVERRGCTPRHACPAGQEMRMVNGSESCMQCPVGSISSGGACEPCTEPGKRANDVQTACESCGAGTQPSPDNATCVACSDLPGAKISMFGIECQDCDGGTVPNSERTACETCPSNQVGHDGVCQCRSDHYNTSAGTLHCVANHVGSDAYHNNDIGICKPCPWCGICDGTILPLVKSGYVELPSTWNSLPVLAGSIDSIGKRNERIRLAFRCEIHHSEERSSTCSPKFARQASPSACAPNRTGLLCQSCATNFHTVDRECVQCEDGLSWLQTYRLFQIASVVVLGVGVRYWWRWWAKRQSERDQDKPVAGQAERQWAIRLRVAYQAMFQPVRMVVTWAQIVAQIDGVLQFQFPTMFASAVQALHFLQEVTDLFFDSECAGLDEFPTRWRVKVIVTPGVALICVATTRVWYTWQDGGAVAVQKAKSLGFGILFLLYPCICNMAFATFECRELVKDEPTRILDADDRFLCDREEISQLQDLSLLVIIFFAVGVPVIFGAILWWNTRAYESQHTTEVATRLAAQFKVDQMVANYVLRDVTTMGASFSFLLDAYKFQWYYWEMLDMLRKLLLVGLVLLVKRGSVAQNMVALVLSLAFFALQISAKPYKLQQDNIYRAATELHVFLVI
eukprot:COSAG02_NODE_4349_length_5466_cov_31.632569_3_plen_1141_part_01